MSQTRTHNVIYIEPKSNNLYEKRRIKRKPLLSVWKIKEKDIVEQSNHISSILRVICKQALIKMTKIKDLLKHVLTTTKKELTYFSKC